MLNRWAIPVLMLAIGIGLGALGNGRVDAGANPPVKIQNLLRADLALAENLEVIVSLVEIAPGAALPKHHHPGEEFVYVLEGKSTLWQQGKADIELQAGDLYKISIEQVHAAMTDTQSAKALVFRVHRKGMPERIAN